MLWDNHYGNAEKYWWWVPWYSGGRYVNGDGVTVSDKSPEMEGVLVVSESGEPLVIIEGDTGQYHVWGQYVDPYSGSIYLWVHDLLNNAFLSAGREAPCYVVDPVGGPPYEAIAFPDMPSVWPLVPSPPNIFNAWSKPAAGILVPPAGL